MMLPTTLHQPGAVQGQVRRLLRLEALTLLCSSLYAFHLWGQPLGWAGFAALFLLPDLALLAYLAGPAWGARAYNLTHSTVLPLTLLMLLIQFSPTGVALCLVWLAHIAFDRCLGFGLKYGEGFGLTHLGRLKWGTPTSK